MTPHRAPAAARPPRAVGGRPLDLDWDLALRLARTGTPGGPRVTAGERSALVRLLREAAAEAPARVGELTGLGAAARAVPRSTDAHVVDRDAARRGAVDALRSAVDASPRAAGAGGDAGPSGARSLGRAASRRLAAAEAAAALGLVSTRLLGEVLPAAPGGRTRVLLVAPNVLEARRRHDLDLADLARWIALHETVHAVQLCAAPWLAGHLAALLAEAVGAATRRDAPRARAAAGRLSTALALLEGHAEAALDGVGVEELPSVHRLRAVVGPSRAGVLTEVVERLSGARGKAAQHADGAAFVRGVRDRAGDEGVAALWTGPGALPTPVELTSPGEWIARVLE